MHLYWFIKIFLRLNSIINIVFKTIHSFKILNRNKRKKSIGGYKNNGKSVAKLLYLEIKNYIDNTMIFFINGCIIV